MSGDLERQVEGLAGEVSELAETVEGLEAHSEAVAELNEHVAKLKQDLGQAADRDELAALAEEVSQIGEALNEARTVFNATLATLNDRMDQIREAQTAAVDGGAVLPAIRAESWLDAAPVDAFALIEGVYDWGVTVGPHLKPELEVRVGCWSLHPTVVQLLIDARFTWRWLYRSGQSRPSDLAAWRRDGWKNLNTEIREELSACHDQMLQGKCAPVETLKYHQEPTESSAWSMGEQPVTTLEHVAQQWAGRTIGRPKPEPAPEQLS